MIITSYAEGGFKIQTSGTVVLIESAFTKTSGRLKYDIFIKTKPDSADDDLVEDTESHIIKGPGEYEIKDVEIRGFPPYIYLIKTEEFKIGYFGENNVSEPAFDPLVAEKLQDLDIIFAYDNTSSAKVIRQFHPKIVVVIKSGDHLEKEFGEKIELIEKLTIKKKDLINQPLKLVNIK